jgi:hypothetical protein
MQKKGESL